MDAFDEEARQLTQRRKEFWAEAREQMAARDVKALKDAIKLRRKRLADPDGVQAHDDRVAEILAEIEAKKSRTARVRVAKDVPSHDLETGEITEPQESREDAAPHPLPSEASEPSPSQTLTTAETAAPTPTASDASLPGHASIAGAGEAGDSSPSASPTIAEDVELPAILDRRSKAA